MDVDGIVSCKKNRCAHLACFKASRVFQALSCAALRQVVADAQHTEQLATLSRRRSEVRVSALEEMRVLKCFEVGVLLQSSCNLLHTFYDLLRSQ